MDIISMFLSHYRRKLHTNKGQTTTRGLDDKIHARTKCSPSLIIMYCLFTNILNILFISTWTKTERNESMGWKLFYKLFCVFV